MKKHLQSLTPVALYARVFHGLDANFSVSFQLRTLKV